jgi:hypothetical protein
VSREDFTLTSDPVFGGDRQRITIRIDGVDLPLRVLRCEEPLLRNARKRIDSTLQKYRVEYPYKKEMPANTYLQMACIDQAYRVECLLQKEQTRETFADRLVGLNEELELFLGKYESNQ